MYSRDSKDIYLFCVDTYKVKCRIKAIIYSIQAKMLLLRCPNKYGTNIFGFSYPTDYLNFLIRFV